MESSVVIFPFMDHAFVGVKKGKSVWPAGWWWKSSLSARSSLVTPQWRVGGTLPYCQVGFEVQASHMVSIYTARYKCHDHSVGMSPACLAPAWARSTSLQPGEGVSQGFRLNLCWCERSGATVYSMVLGWRIAVIFCVLSGKTTHFPVLWLERAGFLGNFFVQHLGCWLLQLQVWYIWGKTKTKGFHCCVVPCISRSLANLLSIF